MMLMMIAFLLLICLLFFLFCTDVIDDAIAGANLVVVLMM